MLFVAIAMAVNTKENILERRISGDRVDVCKCNVPCPCTSAQTPSYGDCEGVMAYHIKRDNYFQPGAINTDVAAHSIVSRKRYKELILRRLLQK
jgi:hypothetical protein